jgi:putative transposase
MESRSNRASRRSVRLPGFDYSRVGMYFVTICASERQCIFGEIRGNAAVLSPIGELVRTCWIEIPRHFPNLKIETYIVMPNHLHGPLSIHSKFSDATVQDKATEATESYGKSTPKSIPTIIRSFKSAVSKCARESGLVMGESIWQRGYYEHVLRNTREYVEITNYILQNPAQWADDEENLSRKSGLV